jgi:hypothetical protein
MPDSCTNVTVVTFRRSREIVGLVGSLESELVGTKPGQVSAIPLAPPSRTQDPKLSSDENRFPSQCHPSLSQALSSS